MKERRYLIEKNNYYKKINKFVLVYLSKNSLDNLLLNEA